VTREEASKAIEQHARLTAQVAQSIFFNGAATTENVLEAIRIEARTLVMRRRRRNGFEPPSNDGEPTPGAPSP